MSNTSQPFDPQIGITPVTDPLGYTYEPGTFGPTPELRSLDAIRPSLRDPNCSGPDPVYAIAMDFGRDENRAQLQERMLLFGAVTYAAGRLGEDRLAARATFIASQSIAAGLRRKFLKCGPAPRASTCRSSLRTIPAAATRLRPAQDR